MRHLKSLNNLITYNLPQILVMIKSKPANNRDYLFNRASLVAQTVMKPPAMEETWVQPLGQEHPLEKGMATHSSIWGFWLLFFSIFHF